MSARPTGDHPSGLGYLSRAGVGHRGERGRVFTAQPTHTMKTPKLLSLLALSAGLPLAVFASPAVDRQIEDSAKNSYNFNHVLDKKVDVKVRDGVVTLTGKVQDDAQRQLAENTVADLQGVTRVNNEIKVEGGAKEGSDAWIAAKIRSTLIARANVSFTDTKVDVTNGAVLLTGTADSTAQKELTEAYVKDIQGVRSVNNMLRVVEKPARAAVNTDINNNNVADRRAVRTDGTTAGDKMDDASITAQIKYELLSHRSTSALKTKVNTINGKVIISGDAQSDAEKDLVTKLAKDVRGVTDVDNNMTVRK